MGRIKNKTVKRASRELIEKYYYKLSDDFHINKKVLDSVSEVPSKRMRNKIAGYTTHLMKRIQKGPVRGISLKIQEEERERMFDTAPEKSNIDINQPLESETYVLNMLESQGLKNILKNKLVVKKAIGLLS